jgi:hypothetical protein
VLGAQSGASYGNQRWRPLFSLVACPIINDAGERLGTAVEWRDRTAEVNIEQAVASIISAAAAGISAVASTPPK